MLESDSISQRHKKSSNAGKHTRYRDSKCVVKMITFAWILIILYDNIGKYRHLGHTRNWARNLTKNANVFNFRRLVLSRQKELWAKIAQIWSQDILGRFPHPYPHRGWLCRTRSQNMYFPGKIYYKVNILPPTLST